jgi:hypothetical protein
MVSIRRLAANRTNARLSTGPKSAGGKARSRLNAVKHGLAIPASAIPDLAPEIAHLTQLIAGTLATDPLIYEAAARVAEATLDVLRVRSARTETLFKLTREPVSLPAATAVRPELVRSEIDRLSSSGAPTPTTISGKHQLQRAEMAEAEQTLKCAGEMPRFSSSEQAIGYWLTQYSVDWGLLDKLDRYERRALSRRNTAIKGFDALKTAHQSPYKESG